MTSRFLTWAGLGIVTPLTKMGLSREEIGWEVCKNLTLRSNSK